MSVKNNSTNLYTNTKYIVSAAGDTPYSTIQSAINDANTAGVPAVIYIRPGAYTENLTLYSTINLEGSETDIVSITGHHTPPVTGSFSCTRITFIATGTDDVLSNANAGDTSIKFTRCAFSVADGYICDLPLWTGSLTFKYCSGGTSVKNGIFNNGSSTSPLTIQNSNLGYGTANPMIINGVTSLDNAKIRCPITLSGSAVSIFEGGSTFEGTITVNASADLQISNSRIPTGSASCLIIDSSVAVKLSNVVLDSNHAYVIRTSNPGTTTGSYKPSEATFPNGKTIGSGITEILTGVVKTGEIFADTITRMNITGFYAFTGAAPYYDDTTLGTFTLTAAAAGSGYIKGRLVTWAGSQSVTGMTSGSCWFIYIDSTGTIGKTSTRTDSLFIDYIVLFSCLYDETTGTKLQHTVKENHAYSFQTSVSNYLHDTVGAIIENFNNGANIIAGTTALRVSISGSDVLDDHGLDTTISTATDVTWKKFYKNAAGKWAVDAVGTDFAGRFNNAGTPTNLTIGKYAVYRLYVGKDNTTTTSPIYYAVLNSAEYSNAGAAASAISAGTISIADGELAALELAQLGFITQGPGTGGNITNFTISKSTLRSSISAGSGASVATSVATNTANFNNLLSAADTNVQAALDTLDDTFVNIAAATDSPRVYFKKYRAAAALTSGDLTGTVKFGGYDGTQVTDSARITSTSSGTIASTRVAGDLKFYTHPDSAAADPTLRMTIGPAGNITVAAPDAGTALTVTAGGITATAGNIAASSGTLSASTTVTAGTNLVSTAGNLLLPTTTSTVGKIVFTSGQVLHCYGDTTNGNIFFGKNAGNFTLTKVNAIGNFGFGENVMQTLTDGSCNVIIGSRSLQAVTTGSFNSGIGYGILYSITQGSHNFALGSTALDILTTGSYNIAIGYDDASGHGAGHNYTGAESSNILIHNAGTVGESNKIRIGTQGTGSGEQDAAYIAGIYNTAVGATAGVVLSDSAHKLGGLAGAANTIFVGGTKPSFTASPTVSGTLSGNAISSTTTVTAGTNLVSTAGNLLLPTTSSTVGQIQINSIRFMHAAGVNSTFIGEASGNAGFTSVGGNTGCGYHTLTSLGTGTNNSAFGTNSLATLSDGSYNTGFGQGSGYKITTGINNQCIGWYTLFNTTTGSRNIAIGGYWDSSGGGFNYGAGIDQAGADSDNILIHSKGVSGESNKLRIGQATGTGKTELDAAYICGIYNTAVGATAGVVLSDSANKLGGLAGSAGQVLMGGTKPAFSTATYPATTAQGDLLLSTSNNTIQALSKDTNATRYLSNTGTSNNAAWAQVALATGVSGTLPPANGGRNSVSESTTSNSVQMAINTTYIATSTDGATLVTYTLPATAAVGDQVKVIGKSTAFWKVAQNATDTIFYGAATSTPGATGYATTAQTYASATFTCITASSIWVITEFAGTITLA